MSDPIALVVDDEPLILMDTADIVASAGYHVIEARSADEAFELLAKYRSVKLVMTDVQMPGTMDGMALARYVGEHWPESMSSSHPAPSRRKTTSFRKAPGSLGSRSIRHSCLKRCKSSKEKANPGRTAE
ncbi:MULTISPECIES: response regulator [unclassified Rhizobium]|uniref:response regulator n=1 Tax=unclassified Rhizobium TaxID=2613769 RepID=UPI00071420BB|nr:MULTISPECIES: response regulator [unclassified Rhizobium]KQS85013.1 hypothetical protein ASG50_29345 [Rhizobium sp. Leaf386]KQS95751.1 hypothetical protein ASG42_28940 [Rhizobium sp. Leaf391]KQU05987.1 hypothetical protein ASG68_24870 [Rhizobium sp. Leaf453]